MTSDEIRTFCEDYVRRWEREDVTGLTACYNEDCEIVSPIFNILRGRAQLETSFLDLFRAFSDFQFSVNDVIVDRDRNERAVLLFTARLTHHGEIFGRPGTGRRFEVHGAFVFTFENDRISRDSRLYDFTGMLMQLGVLRARTA
jgi:steroid delta-isomerase-like uncharacterized protein